MTVKDSKDRIDGHVVGWYRGTAMRDDMCICCGKGYRKGARCYVERVLPGVNVRPKTLHSSCWKLHAAKTEREATAARRERKADAAVKLADEVLG